MIQVDNLTVSLIDFGLAQLFRNPTTYLHIPYSMDHSIIGTLLFTSIHGQQGHAQSRYDDLESLAYTIICSAHSNLPWTSFSTQSDKKAVLEKKLSITVEELCEGLPTPFYKFVGHVCSLGFDEKPDYQYLHSILSQCSQTEPSKVLLSSARSPVSLDSVPISGDQV
jgi:serine/threonine protein kinase